MTGVSVTNVGSPIYQVNPDTTTIELAFNVENSNPSPFDPSITSSSFKVYSVSEPDALAIAPTNQTITTSSLGDNWWKVNISGQIPPGFNRDYTITTTFNKGQNQGITDSFMDDYIANNLGSITLTANFSDGSSLSDTFQGPVSPIGVELIINSFEVSYN